MLPQSSGNGGAANRLGGTSYRPIQRVWPIPSIRAPFYITQKLLHRRPPATAWRFQSLPSAAPLPSGAASNLYAGPTRCQLPAVSLLTTRRWLRQAATITVHFLPQLLEQLQQSTRSERIQHHLNVPAHEQLCQLRPACGQCSGQCDAQVPLAASSWLSFSAPPPR